MFWEMFGNKPVRNKVRFLGVHNDSPAIEFQGVAPPDWFLKAMREKVMHVADGVCYLKDVALEPGATIHRKAVQ
jgi:hypothetical protein